LESHGVCDLPIKICYFKQLCWDYQGFQPRISKKRKSDLGRTISSSLVDSFEIGVEFHILCWKSNGRGIEYIILQVENRPLSPTHIKITASHWLIPEGPFVKMNFLKECLIIYYVSFINSLFLILIFKINNTQKINTSKNSN